MLTTRTRATHCLDLQICWIDLYQALVTGSLLGITKVGADLHRCEGRVALTRGVKWGHTNKTMDARLELGVPMHVRAVNK